MDKYSERKILTVSTAVVIILAAASAAAQDTPTDLGPVLVTAQKRVQALADIPMSVSVLSGETLDRQQADNFQDFVALVPGLSINSSTRGVTRLSLRGINTGGVASTVGVYVDDVPFGSSSGLANGAILSGDFDTFDLARIEVLRGPQGTLYGASSLGGVLKYVVNQPSTEAFEGRVQATTETVEDGDLGYSMAGVLNMPVSETLAVRASAFFRSDAGFIDSIGNNPIPAIILDPDAPPVNIVDGTRVEDDLNGLDTYGGRISALFAPSDQFSLNLTAVMQNIESENADVFEADPVTFEPLYGGLVASRYHPEYTDIDYRIYSATLDWDFGGASLQSVTSYGTFEENFQRDIAALQNLSQVLTFLFSDPITAQPPLSLIQQQITSTDKFTQELRLVSPENQKFEWLIGAYYTDEESLIAQDFYPVNAGTETIVTGLPLLGELALDSTYEELALFANATWHITDRFDLSFGGRISENDQVASQVSDGILAGGPNAFVNLKSSETPFTWSVSPRFEVSENTSVYARIATGFRPGGPNVLPPDPPPGTPPTYDSDELTSYEIGLKTASEDGRFSLDVAAFFLDWEDVQLLTTINDFNINANGGTAESQGVEFSAALHPGDGLSLSLNGAYTDASLTEDTDPIVGGLDGDPLSYVPEWSLGFGGDYEWTVLNGATAYVGGLVAYTGSRPADFSNRTTDGSIREAESYTKLDLRTGIDTGRWTIELYAKNITDERGINSINEEGPFPNGAVGIAVIRPRTIGLSVGARF